MSEIDISTTGTTKTGGLAFNLAAALCYVPISPINFLSSVVWIATEPKESKFVRFHAFQALFWFIGGGMGLGLVIGFLSVLVGVLSGLEVLPDSAMLILSLVLVLVDLALLAGFAVGTLLGLYKAYSGQMWRIPVIGGLAERMAG